MTLGILALFFLFVAHPLVLVLYKSVLSENGNLSLAYLTKFFVRKCYWNVSVNNFKVTIISTLVAAVLGLAMTRVLRSMQTKGSKYLNILIVISYLSSPFIGAYAWIQLLGRNGFFTKILSSLFHIKLDGIYGFAGIVLVFFLQPFPLVYMYISGTLGSLDNSLNEAAESLGCTAPQRVTWTIAPLVMPTILANSLLVLMCVLSDFDTPVLIGEGYKTFPVLIYSQFMGEISTDSHLAAALRVIVIGIILVLFFLQCYLGSRFTYSMTALKPMMAEKCTGTRNIPSHLFVYTVVLAAILPQITAIVTSFLAIGSGMVHIGDFFLENYRNILLSKDNNTAIFNTYLFGVRTIAIVVVFGTLISYLIVRKRSLLADILGTMATFPHIIPSSILSISLLYTFNSEPLLLSGTAIIIVMSLSIRRMPYTIRSSTTIIGQISPSVEKAAISLGRTEIKSFVEVTAPAMMSGVFPGVIVSWTILIGELSSSIILYIDRAQTPTAVTHAGVIRSNFGNTAVYSIILTLTSTLSLLVFFRVIGSNDTSI